MAKPIVQYTNGSRPSHLRIDANYDLKIEPEPNDDLLVEHRPAGTILQLRDPDRIAIIVNYKPNALREAQLSRLHRQSSLRGSESSLHIGPDPSSPEHGSYCRRFSIQQATSHGIPGSPKEPQEWPDFQTGNCAFLAVKIQVQQDTPPSPGAAASAASDMPTQILTTTVKLLMVEASHDQKSTTEPANQLFVHMALREIKPGTGKYIPDTTLINSYLPTNVFGTALVAARSLAATTSFRNEPGMAPGNRIGGIIQDWSIAILPSAQQTMEDFWPKLVNIVAYGVPDWTPARGPTDIYRVSQRNVADRGQTLTLFTPNEYSYEFIPPHTILFLLLLECDPAQREFYEYIEEAV